MNSEKGKSIEALDKAVNTDDKQIQTKSYEEYVKQVTPTKSLPLNMLKAFIVGGIICCIGQFILNLLTSYGMSKDDAASWTSLSLVALAVILTGFGTSPLSQS